MASSLEVALKSQFYHSIPLSLGYKITRFSLLPLMVLLRLGTTGMSELTNTVEYYIDAKFIT